jgi:tetratricopeptide (TPR) repeat protein
LSVPFIAQKPNYCGPAALAMLANYYGHNVSQDEIANAIYLPEIRGTLTTELADYARRFNLWVHPYRGSPADLRQKLAAGVPLLVLGKLGAQYHYFVVLAVNEFRQTVTVHSDTRPFLEMREEDFLRFWDRANRWTLLICPPERVRWKLSAEEHNDLGVYLEGAGQWAAAGEHYRAAVALRPDKSYFHMNLGNVLLKQRRLQEAVDAFARAVVTDPANADALNNLACVYLELGENLDNAVHLSRKAMLMRPSHRAYYLDTLGSIFLKQGKPKDAVSAFEEALAGTTDRQSSLRTNIEQRLAAARALLKK